MYEWVIFLVFISVLGLLSGLAFLKLKINDEVKEQYSEAGPRPLFNEQTTKEKKEEKKDYTPVQGEGGGGQQPSPAPQPSPGPTTRPVPEGGERPDLAYIAALDVLNNFGKYITEVAKYGIENAGTRLNINAGGDVNVSGNIGSNNQISGSTGSIYSRPTFGAGQEQPPTPRPPYSPEPKPEPAPTPVGEDEENYEFMTPGVAYTHAREAGYRPDEEGEESEEQGERRPAPRPRRRQEWTSTTPGDAYNRAVQAGYRPQREAEGEETEITHPTGIRPDLIERARTGVEEYEEKRGEKEAAELYRRTEESIKENKAARELIEGVEEAKAAELYKRAERSARKNKYARKWIESAEVEKGYAAAREFLDRVDKISERATRRGSYKSKEEEAAGVLGSVFGRLEKMLEKLSRKGYASDFGNVRYVDRASRPVGYGGVVSSEREAEAVARNLALEQQKMEQSRKELSEYLAKIEGNKMIEQSNQNYAEETEWEQAYQSSYVLKPLESKYKEISETLNGIEQNLKKIDEKIMDQYLSKDRRGYGELKKMESEKELERLAGELEKQYKTVEKAEKELYSLKKELTDLKQRGYGVDSLLKEISKDLEKAREAKEYIQMTSEYINKTTEKGEKY